MTRTLRISTLVENAVHRPGCLAEHGFSLLLNTGTQSILFDTGAGQVLLSNARKLGADLSQIDAIVLSHGHYDHTGGLSQALCAAPRAKVFVHPEALAPKFTKKDDGIGRYIGLPPLSEKAIRNKDCTVLRTSGPMEIADGLYVTGPIPRTTEFEDPGGPFFLDASCEIPDPLPDDQAAFFRSSKGTVVILGCAHAGVINTVQHVYRLTKEEPIHAIVGGMHLHRVTKERVSHTLCALRKFSIEHLWPAHCTGMASTAAFWRAFPGRCHPCSVGTSMGF